MRICLICVEIFAWGKYGGFGRATRIIGRELVRRGFSVDAVVPRRPGQAAQERLDGISVLSFQPYNLAQALRLFRDVDADVYHSEEPSLLTFLAQRAAPHKRHMITFRDTRDRLDWRTELRLPSLNRGQVLLNRLFEDNFLVHRAVRSANARFAAAKFLIQKAEQKYRLAQAPGFLPTPVPIPREIVKAPQATVAFVSRWDRRKRPELYFRLPEVFPEVRFIAVGHSRDAEYDRYLRSRYGRVPNLQMMDFINQFQDDSLSRILERSWVLVNTSARESLPNSFLEACAHKSAILSSVDPDGFASRFGYCAPDGEYAQGLEDLLEGNVWRERAERGHEYVRRVFGMQPAISQHIEAYRELGPDLEHGV